MTVDLKALSASFSRDLPTTPDMRRDVSIYLMKASVLMLLGLFLVLFFYKNTITAITIVEGVVTIAIGYGPFNELNVLVETQGLFPFLGLFLYFSGLVYLSRVFKAMPQKDQKNNGPFAALFLAGILVLIFGTYLVVISGGNFRFGPPIGTIVELIGILLMVIANVWLIVGMIRFGKVAGTPAVGMFSILLIVPFADLIPPLVNFSYAYLLWYSEERKDSIENKS